MTKNPGILLRVGGAALATAYLAMNAPVVAVAPIVAQAIFFFESGDLSVVDAGDGSRLIRVSNKPTWSRTGVRLGTGSATGLFPGAGGSASGPDFFPIHVTTDVASQRVHITDLRALPSVNRAFHRATTYLAGSGATGPGAITFGPDGRLYILAAIDNETAAPRQVFNLADDFTQPRVIGTVADTNRAYRNRSISHLVPHPGQRLQIGATYSFSAANVNQTFSLSHIDTATGGATVTCTPIDGCWWRGFGQFNDLRGTAGAIPISTLAVSGDTAAQLTVTRVASGTQPGEGACPPGAPPAPSNVFALGRLSTSGAVLTWDSVVCADEYEVVVNDGGVPRVVRTRDTRVEIPGVDAPLASYEIRAIGANGVAGPPATGRIAAF